MAINKTKLKTLTRLSDRGFDTHKKILAIDMRAARDNGLDDDIRASTIGRCPEVFTLEEATEDTDQLLDPHKIQFAGLLMHKGT